MVVASNLAPAAVAARLERLRALYQPLREAEARALMEERPSTDETFAQGVSRRLSELRALMELTRALHGARVNERTQVGADESK